ncbi:MAG: flagellar hook capping FlgD N-terminal domain-containing protein [Oscillospiraceae bacterium]|nr:flagellar hook capping FlgD N-terminal domain-containing protein [Oscillospiraceae bacterium]
MSTAVGNVSLFSSSSSSASTSSTSSTMTASDFLKLFVTQLQNQDFNDPMDNSEMMNQITQLSNMQMMQQMAEYSKTSYAMSLVGKTVTASRYVNGKLDTTTGTISKVSLVDNEYVLYVNGKKYGLEQVMEIQENADGGSLDVSSHPVSASAVTDSSATVSWDIPTEDSTVANGLTYTVYYSTEGPFDTVSAVKNGTGFGAKNQYDLLGAEITGLDAGQSYYINVLVKDSDGNEYVYKPALIATNK